MSLLRAESFGHLLEKGRLGNWFPRIYFTVLIHSGSQKLLHLCSKGTLAAYCIGSGCWHCPNETDFTGMQNTSMGLGRRLATFPSPGSPGKESLRGQCEAVEMKPKCTGDSRKLEMTGKWELSWGRLLSKSRCWRESIWVATSKIIGMRLPEPSGTHIYSFVPWTYMWNLELHDLMFALLDFNLALVHLFSVVFLPFKMGMFPLCYCILFFIFTKTHKFALSIRIIFNFKKMLNYCWDLGEWIVAFLNVCGMVVLC